jgi:hypothetical protein
MGERRRGEECSLRVGLRQKRGCKGAGHPEREGAAWVSRYFWSFWMRGGWCPMGRERKVGVTSKVRRIISWELLKFGQKEGI